MPEPFPPSAPRSPLDDPERVTYFAQTDARNKRVPFGIKAKDRSKHFYVIGKTGMGKSTLLENMAVQDIRSGEGLAFLDPHGATAEKLLDYVPEERIKDVLYFAPFDMDYPIAFNVMEDVGPDKRHLVVNGLMSTFEKIWVDAWSARMAYILQNTLLALLEFPGSTLLGVNRMLSDKDYRRAVVQNITDPSVKSFWVDEFAKYTERFAAEATPAIQNKVGQFTSNPLIRNIIGQSKSTFDLRHMLDERKIIIVNLSKGRVGEGNALLLGSMLITRIYLSAMSRADSSSAALTRLPNFYLYVDEFQSFANKSFENILSEARKYKLNLTIAHQYVEQMEEEIQAAVFGNVGTTVAFRVGPLDAELLEKIFMPQFTATDLVSLGFAQVYLTLMIDGVGSPPFSATTLPPLPPPALSYREQIIANSRAVFSRPRVVVEDDIKKWHEPLPSPAPAPRSGAGAALRESRDVRPSPTRRPFTGPRPPTASSASAPTPAPKAPQAPLPPAPKASPSPAVPRPVPAREAVESERMAHLRATLAEALKKRAPERPKESPSENREGLRNALAEVLKKTAAPEAPVAPSSALSPNASPAAPPLAAGMASPSSLTSSGTAPRTPKDEAKREVPEEVLRKVLKGESP